MRGTRRHIRAILRSLRGISYRYVDSEQIDKQSIVVLGARDMRLTVVVCLL